MALHRFSFVKKLILKLEKFRVLSEQNQSGSQLQSEQEVLQVAAAAANASGEQLWRQRSSLVLVLF